MIVMIKLVMGCYFSTDPLLSIYAMKKVCALSKIAKSTYKYNKN